MTTSLTLTATSARIPIGWATINGQRVPVTVDQEWARAFEDLQLRVGGTVAMSNVELAEMAMNPPRAIDPQAAEALRAIDELRNELASTRAHLDGVLRLIDTLSAEMAGARAPIFPEVQALIEELTTRPTDSALAARVQQIEDRLA